MNLNKHKDWQIAVNSAVFYAELDYRHGKKMISAKKLITRLANNYGDMVYKNAHAVYLRNVYGATYRGYFLGKTGNLYVC